MHIIAGDRRALALEAEIEEPCDPNWFHGHFRMWINCKEVGDWGDHVTLKGVLAWWESFIDDRRDRWDPTLADLDTGAMFEALYGAAYVEGRTAIENAYARFHINYLGMSAFDPFVVLLVEEPQGHQRLLWRRIGGEHEVHAANLPAHALQQVGAEFVGALRAAFTSASLGRSGHNT